jgi:Undecaprenyl-phosphate glucose phosphotransferase
MTNTHLFESTPSVPRISIAEVVTGSNDRATEPHPRARITRSQIADISIVLDALIVCSAFVLAQYLYLIVSGAGLSSDANYALVGVVTGLLHYVVTRTGQESTRQLGSGSTWSVFRHLLITFAIVIVIGYALKQAEVHSRLWFGLSLIAAFVLISLKNRIIDRLVATGMLREYVVERIALFGDASIATQFKSSLEREHDNLCRVSVYESGAGDGGARAIEGTALYRLIADGLHDQFDRIVFCIPPAQIDQVKGLVDAISFLPARIEICLAQAELQTLRSSLLIAPGQLLVSIDGRPQDAWGAMLKRIMDLALGSIFLVMSIPVLILAGIAVKLETAGPVFFRQRRHGWNHSIITVWKLRTMTVTEDGTNIKQAAPEDPRITRVGRFLRNTSIDELPQLINVLGGEMSLVGPRPHALAHNVHYSERIASYASRHIVKPGMTGWAQVNGLRGNSEDIAKMVARAEADIWYIRNWSILLDLKILLMTPFAVYFQKNAG